MGCMAVMLVCVWRLVRECRAFAGRAGGALIGEIVASRSPAHVSLTNSLSYACLRVLRGCGCSRPFVAALPVHLSGFSGA